MAMATVFSVRALVAASLYAASVITASATGDIDCTAMGDPGTSISIGVGHLPVLSVLSATVRHGDELWSTMEGEDRMPIAMGQGLIETDRIAIDFTDPNIERILISLRVIIAMDGRSVAQAGTLTIRGTGAFAVQCTTN